MADDVAEKVGSSAANSDLPFRMSEMKLIREIPAHIPLADTMNTVQKEWLFQWKLLRNDWTRSHYTTILFGFLALIFGSVSSELINGGDAKVSGLDGVCHQRLPVFPSHGLADLLGLVCLPGLDVVSRHANSRHIALGDVERSGGCPDFFSSKEPNVSGGPESV